MFDQTERMGGAAVLAFKPLFQGCEWAQRAASSGDSSSAACAVSAVAAEANMTTRTRRNMRLIIGLRARPASGVGSALFNVRPQVQADGHAETLARDAIGGTFQGGQQISQQTGILGRQSG